ncbi:hypothetical protein Acr_24g0001040 [Actinidia rufa]|uniref:BZIP domain-containing protein n=1 Tax=Actinidia rufa TaxID=165716 RepID=A0A7J0GTP1_9ERIC|nr:hypothetical protein Acr_24g0001040 [Actinidia rufa]
MVKHISSSSSEGDERYAMVDEKKRKRMISNRESARRSRMRREQHIKDLNCQITYFNTKNCEIAQKTNSITQQSIDVELENQVLMRMRDELRKKLESLEIVSSYVCANRGDFPRHNSQPWLLSCQSVLLNYQA